MRQLAAPVILAALLGSCAAPPPNPAFGKSWSSNAEGYVFTVGYFTKEQVRSKGWEKARIEASKLVFFCDGAQIVRRDVRWFEPAAEGQPQCAAVIYSFTCPVRRPEWGSSLAYVREQALLDEPRWPIEPGCGEKDRTKLPPAKTPDRNSPAFGRYGTVSDTVSCEASPDADRGPFHLQPVTYIHPTTTVSPAFAEATDNFYPSSPEGFLSYAAAQEQKVHLMTVRDGKARNDADIFLQQRFAMMPDGKGYCVTVEARQGDSLWRRTIRRPALKSPGPREIDMASHARDPERVWTIYSDAHRLLHPLARKLGLPIPETHATPSWPSAD